MIVECYSGKIKVRIILSADAVVGYLPLFGRIHRNIRNGRDKLGKEAQSWMIGIAQPAALAYAIVCCDELTRYRTANDRSS